MTDTQPQSVITVTDAARAVILDARGGEPEPDTLALWLEVSGEAAGSFTYDLWFQAVADAGPNEAVQHHDGLSVVIGPGSVDKLRGARIDADPDGGMVVDNPNKPAAAAASPSMTGPPPDLTGDIPQRVIQVLEEQINPSIAMHGGMAELVAIEDGIAYLRLSGGCQGCGLAAVTLSQGIAVAIKESVPEVIDVRDVTDHSSGSNPYYEAAKK